MQTRSWGPSALQPGCDVQRDWRPEAAHEERARQARAAHVALPAHPATQLLGPSAHESSGRPGLEGAGECSCGGGKVCPAQSPPGERTLLLPCRDPGGCQSAGKEERGGRPGGGGFALWEGCSGCAGVCEHRSVCRRARVPVHTCVERPLRSLQRFASKPAQLGEGRPRRAAQPLGKDEVSLHPHLEGGAPRVLPPPGDPGDLAEDCAVPGPSVHCGLGMEPVCTPGSRRPALPAQPTHPACLRALPENRVWGALWEAAPEKPWAATWALRQCS